MMKRRSKPAISRVRLDGRSKDERYRTDNSRALSSQLPRESFFSSLVRSTRAEGIVALTCTRAFNTLHVLADRFNVADIKDSYFRYRNLISPNLGLRLIAQKLTFRRLCIRVLIIKQIQSP